LLPPRRSAVFSGNAEYPDKIPQDDVTQPYFARKIGYDMSLAGFGSSR